MFALAGPERPALYFTVVGEPPLKMLRYQQQFTFFDVARVNESVRYVNLSQEVVDGTLEKLWPASFGSRKTSPGVVSIPFRTSPRLPAHTEPTSICNTRQQLAIRLTG
jgi:circadian clock protein KaiC